MGWGKACVRRVERFAHDFPNLDLFYRSQQMVRGTQCCDVARKTYYLILAGKVGWGWK